MAIKLTKKIQRELLATPHHAGLAMNVQLLPGDSVGFRVKCKKTVYEVSLHKVFLLAVMQKINSEYQSKIEHWKARKPLGLKCKKPRRPSMAMFSRELKHVLSTNLSVTRPR